MSDQPCRTCGQPGRTVPLTMEGQVIGEAVIHETGEGVMTHSYVYPGSLVLPETLHSTSGFSVRVPDEDEPDVPWSRAVTPLPPAEPEP